MVDELKSCYPVLDKVAFGGLLVTHAEGKNPDHYRGCGSDDANSGEYTYSASHHRILMVVTDRYQGSNTNRLETIEALIRSWKL
jgi:hypothetical protein